MSQRADAGRHVERPSFGASSSCSSPSACCAAASTCCCSPTSAPASASSWRWPACSAGWRCWARCGWIYGIGLKGKDPTWKPVAVINEPAALATNPIIGGDGFLQATETQPADGWRLLAEDDPERGQAVAASDDILQNQAQVFARRRLHHGGGVRQGRQPASRCSAASTCSPSSTGPTTPSCRCSRSSSRTPSRARHHRRPWPTPTQPPRFVLMERDLGNRRRPAALIFHRLHHHLPAPVLGAAPPGEAGRPPTAARTAPPHRRSARTGRSGV